MSKTKKNAPVELGLKVLHEGYSEETSEVNPDDSWSRASTSTSWSVNGIALATEYPDVTACFPIEKDSSVYLVYTVNSTGDSFGHDEHAHIRFIDVFKDEAKAEAAAKTIREHNDWYKLLNSYWPRLNAKERKQLEKKYKSPYTVNIIRENGKMLDVHAGWNGYFESLSYVEVVHFVVDANKRQRF